MIRDDLLSQKVVSLALRPAPINEVETELNQMWEGFRAGVGNFGNVGNDEAVTRACMSNLLVYCDNSGEAESVRVDLPRILFEHPARVLLLRREDPGTEEGIAARISVHFSNLSQRLQVCGEEVDVACATNAEERLPSAARSLLIGDLPTTLWWASSNPPANAGPLFRALASIADQVIFDSIGWRDPPKDISALARWSSADQDDLVIYNLAWRRLKPWRRLLSEALAPAIAPGALEHAAHIHLEHGPHAMTAAWLLIGWLADHLSWRPEEGKLLSKSEASWRFATRKGHVVVHVQRRPEGEPVIYLIDWQWTGDPPGNAIFKLQENRKLEARMAGDTDCTQALSLPLQDRATLVAEQLAHRSRDRNFERALALASAMPVASR